ncbi:MAG: radical SAM protein [Bacteroidales bacterium]|nr:radical SAM protein [Bacteroidales bacterium]
MPTFLFNEIIFGPVLSRRLGNSLGINLLPVKSKLCNFNCLYCECGLTSSFKQIKKDLPTREQVKSELEKTLHEFNENDRQIDTITFAGNGEPTLHPQFPGIINDSLLLRDKYFPEAKLAVLSNATLIHRKEIKSALEKIDLNILKLDSVNEDTVKIMNCPQGKFSVKKLLANLADVKNLTIQTLFVRGHYKGSQFDNTTEEEIIPWLDTLKKLQPGLVMIYTIARDTPVDTVEKVSAAKLNEIAKRVEAIGIPTSISD